MKSVGEAMAIGRTFKESLQKCLRSLEIGRSGLGERESLATTADLPKLQIGWYLPLRTCKRAIR